MRGFKDHRKLTMVGFRFDRSQCSFGGCGTRSGSSREDCESRTRELVSWLVFGDSLQYRQVSVGEGLGFRRL